MVETKEIKTCTSKIFKKGEKAAECGQTLLMLYAHKTKEPAFICPDCDGLEFIPKKTRERIFEQ